MADPRVAAVTVTGSEAAGRAVASAAGRHLKKSVLELGGSDPFVVLPSADLRPRRDQAVKGRMLNNGQSCIAAKRFIVVDSVYDAFRARFLELVRALRVGDPMDPATDLGPLATAAIREGLHQQVRRSVEAGARLLVGRQAPGRTRASSTPPPCWRTCPPAPRPPARSCSGRWPTLFRARDLDQAIAARQRHPLRTGRLGVHPRTRDEAERCLREIEAGTVFINGLTASDPRFPFGGIKRSGYGRELGVFGLREFVNIKRVRVAL